MVDVTLSDGREVEFDLYKISMAEYRALLEVGQPPEEGDEMVARIIGWKADEVASLPYPDYRKLIRAFFRKASSPLDDPNSASAST